VELAHLVFAVRISGSEIGDPAARQAKKTSTLLRFVAGGLDAVLPDAREKRERMERTRR